MLKLNLEYGSLVSMKLHREIRVIEPNLGQVNTPDNHATALLAAFTLGLRQASYANSLIGWTLYSMAYTQPWSVCLHAYAG
jgi:hypothetical protein